MRSTIALAAVLAFAAAVSAATNCQSPDGTYDLTSLAGSDLPGSDASYNYKLQVCGTATETTCATNGGSFCQYTSANAYQHVLTKWDSTGTWTACPSSTCPNGGVQVYFANGDKCGGSGPARAVTYIINCPSATTPSATSYVVGTQGCIYTVTMTHSSGCATSSGGGGGGGGGGGSKGLSGGSIFLIILVVVIPVYIAVGCVYKRQRQGTSGMESCPNIDFWRDLPALVGDGFKFTWRKCLGLCGKGDANYEGMK